jgi:hypothetical protein
MLKDFDIAEDLIRLKTENGKPEDELLNEVHKILSESVFNEKNILNNLKSYQKSFEQLDEDDLNKNHIFKTEELKKYAIKNRLKFLDSQNYQFDVPYEAILKIKHLNQSQGKNLDGFKIMGDSEGFNKKISNANFVLFAPTKYGNYYLIHSWGTKFKWYKKLSAFPLRNFETLAITILVFVLIVTLSLPTYLITLDRSATYWCGYRIATYFHLLIFFSGVAAYILVGFNKRFNGQVWQLKSDFD